MLIATTLALAAMTPASYDHSAETTLSGTVLHVATATGADGTVGVHLDLKTKDVIVYLSRLRVARS